MEFINKMRKKDKGFTLVEIIVVLVILAVLAAFTIPTMLGFVTDSKKKAATAEQREIYVAAQAITTEYIGKLGATDGATALGVAGTVAVNLGSAAVVADATEAAQKMAGYVEGDITAGAGAADDDTSEWIVYVENGKVTTVSYKKDGLQLDDLVPSGSLD